MKVKEILEASVCAFCKNTFDYYSLDDDEFIKILKDFLIDRNLKALLHEYASEVDYDIENLNNISKVAKCRNKEFNYMDIAKYCRIAYIYTINNEKSINLEAFVDNVIKELDKNK